MAQTGRIFHPHFGMSVCLSQPVRFWGRFGFTMSFLRVLLVVGGWVGPLKIIILRLSCVSNAILKHVELTV